MMPCWVKGSLRSGGSKGGKASKAEHPGNKREDRGLPSQKPGNLGKLRAQSDGDQKGDKLEHPGSGVQTSEA